MFETLNPNPLRGVEVFSKRRLLPVRSRKNPMPWLDPVYGSRANCKAI
jgi:hypothetical protein